ncbi:MAG: haloalkane dehalogenase, partial [Nitriliruptoraceae bacterium]
MDTLRTPEERFDGLADWPFAPHDVEVSDPDGGTLRLRHLDEGDPTGSTVVLLHGEPTWSYLYRHVVPPLVDAGCRVVAPDLVGFGRSDKPVRQEDHTYARQVGWIGEALFDQLGLTEVVLFGQDWGGLIGLRLVAERPERFAGVVVSNTGLPTGDEGATEAFLSWQQAATTMRHFPAGRIVDGGSLRSLSESEIAAYDAPFPDPSFQAGARALPKLVPTSPDDPAAAANRAAWRSLAGFDRPFVTAFADQDPITRGADRPMRKRIPGAAGQPHRTIEGAGHFVQEDAPEAVAE